MATGAIQRGDVKSARTMIALEANLPALTGVVVLALVLWLGPDLQALTDANRWQLSEIYGAIFNLSAILCGALASVYSLLVSSTNKTIDRIRPHPAFTAYLGFVRAAIGYAFIVAVGSIPLLIVKPALISWSDPGTAVAGVWAAGAAAMLAAAFRVLSTARLLFEARGETRLPGG